MKESDKQHQEFIDSMSKEAEAAPLNEEEERKLQYQTAMYRGIPPYRKFVDFMTGVYATGVVSGRIELLMVGFTEVVKLALPDGAKIISEAGKRKANETKW